MVNEMRDFGATLLEHKKVDCGIELVLVSAVFTDRTECV